MKARELDLFEHVATLAASMPDNVFDSPDDDWTPVLFMDGRHGGTMMPLAQLMGTDMEKDMLAEVIIPAAIDQFQPDVVVMVISAWTSEMSSKLLTDTKGQEYVPPSQQPDREEVVYVIEYTREGVTRQAHAQIKRFADAVPRVGEWEDVGDAKSISGRFVDPIVRALKAVRA